MTRHRGQSGIALIELLLIVCAVGVLTAVVLFSVGSENRRNQNVTMVEAHDIELTETPRGTPNVLSYCDNHGMRVRVTSKGGITATQDPTC